MKTITDLNALIPTIVDMLAKNEHEIGESYIEQNEDGWGRCCEPATNYFCYEKDGWLIEITYECCGVWHNDSGDYWTPPSSSLVRAWGEVIELTAIHYDEESDEETEFSNENLLSLWQALNKKLEKIA